MPIMTSLESIEFFYVERSWTFSPRGRASVIGSKFLAKGYLARFVPHNLCKPPDCTAEVSIHSSPETLSSQMDIRKA